MKNLILYAAALVAICGATVASAGASSKCDSEVKAASSLYDQCANNSTTNCDQWQVSRLITLTAAITKCAEAGNSDAKFFLKFMSIHADAALGAQSE
jgi:hypothetical protein